VKAHKQILAIASKFFENEFYESSWGSLSIFGYAQSGCIGDENVDIKIDDVSEEVFQVMINFIYKKQLDWSTYGLNFLSSLYGQASKYDVADLMSQIVKSIHQFWFVIKARSLPFPYNNLKDTALEVATLAHVNHLFPELSEALCDVATIYLKKVFKGRLDAVLDFFSETDITATNAVVFHKMMARMRNLASPECDNCCHSPCLHGQGVTRNNFESGARVTWVLGGGHSQIDRLISVEDYNAELFVGSLKDGSQCNNLTLKPSHYCYQCL